MKFTGSFIGLTLDHSATVKALEEHLVGELHRCTDAWIQVIAGPSGRVPLWSGMARASLLEVSQLVNSQIVISPLKAPSRVQEGAQLGTATQTIRSNLYQIEITTDVEHWNIQEYHKVKRGGSPSAPWQSLQFAAAAFLACAEGVSLPAPVFRPFVRKV
jgi:hypothetical protein